MRRSVLSGWLFLLVACGAEEAKVPSPPAPVPAKASLPSPPAPPALRLPETVWPKKTSARLTIDPARDSFDGAMTIALDVRVPTNVVWLHRDDLAVATGRAVIAGREVVARIVDGGRDYVGFLFPEVLPKGDAELRVLYTGKLSATEVDGASRQIEGNDAYVFTHFEPLAARRVFPCFDEPSFKSPWQLVLRVKKGDVAVSNTPVVSELEENDGYRAVTFAETKPLPSYLVAFAVGPFGFVDAGLVGEKKTKVRIVVPRGKETWAKFAAESTAPVLSRLEEYFGEPYPYEKLDLIAVPLFGGAMENPGLVTYRQSLILAKPGQESTGFRRAFASVNAHELAHQWFGDLVTTRWWDDLWLNEAFATWMTPKIVGAYKPEWDVATTRAQNAGGAMRSDSLTTARAIRQPIASNDDIKNAFDGITYQKGAATIAMVERWVGAEKFQRGVRRYMREHAHRTATSEDFLAAISNEAGKDVAPAFATFLDRPGVPLVGAETRCEGGHATLALTQSRYLPAGAKDAAPIGAPWQIPVCARFGDGKREDATCILLADTKGSATLPYCPAWVLPNDAASGYFRTALAEPDRKKLTKRFSSLTAPEKIATLGDLGALVRSQSVGIDALLDLVPIAAKDGNVHVVELAASTLGGLRDGGLVDPAARPEYEKLVARLFGARARALGLRAKPGENEETRWLRAPIVDLAADQGGDAALRAECTNLAKAWLADRGAVEPETIGTVLGIAASFGDAALFDAYLAEAKRAPDRVDRERLVWALGQFRERSLVDRALALVVGPELDPRESVRILWAELRIPQNAPVVYDFVTARFDAIVARLPRDYGAGFPQVGAALCDASRTKDVEAFFGARAKTFVGGPRQLAQSLEALAQCSAYRTRERKSVSERFSPRK